ncbi:hypothetical protein DVS77_31430 [Mycolicibacterium moriokaense]|nr:hypothetical protein DVS77_31430 [Mycolicibacterium moriokaense]
MAEVSHKRVAIKVNSVDQDRGCDDGAQSSRRGDCLAPHRLVPRRFVESTDVSRLHRRSRGHRRRPNSHRCQQHRRPRCRYAHPINTDDDSGNMAALGAIGSRMQSDNVIQLHG